MAGRFEFENQVLSAAREATFRRRGTALPGLRPLALTPEFFMDPAKQTQWRAFLRKSGLQADAPFEEVVEVISEFLLPVVEGIVDQKKLIYFWRGGGRWKQSESTGKKGFRKSWCSPDCIFEAQ